MSNEYPEYAEIDGKLHKINTDYKFALACFEAIEDEELSDVARAMAVVSILFGQEDENGNITNIPQNIEKALDIASRYLCQGKEPDNKLPTKRDMDFQFDRDLIYASFMSDYKIDIDDTEMHYWKFCSLISGLTENSILNRVRDLRNTDLTLYSDSKQKAKIIEAMERVALPIKYSKEEQEQINEFEALFAEDVINNGKNKK